MFGLGRPENRRLSPKELERRQAKRRERAESLRRDEMRGGASGSEQGGFDESRRRFIRNAVIAVIAATPAVSVINKLYEDRFQRDAANKKTAEILAAPEAESTIPRKYLVPEDERSASDILIAVNPTYSMLLLAGYNFGSAFEKMLDPVLSPLQAGTNVHVTVPLDQKDEFLEEARERYPDLNFIVYEMPNIDNQGYMQDIVFSTGSKDEQGRFVIASSTLDMGQIPRLPEYEPPTLPTINKERLRNLLVDQGETLHAIAGVILLGDEMLARDYPETFKAYRVPVKTEGGDLSITRLPHGGIGLIVGPENLTESIINMANNDAGATKYNAHKPEGPFKGFFTREVEGESKMPASEFVRYMLKMKALYKQHFGVDEVIIFDEKTILAYAANGADNVNVNFDDIKKKSFFHTDMVVKTATDGNGRHVAFCTHSDQSSESAYLHRVARQFEALGYEVVPVPVGYYPATNYVNVQMYTKNGEKVAIVPQYGYPEDAEAVRIYESRGFRVITTDFSNMRDFSREQLMNIGSLHCRAEILS